jgi:hypothetical protein
MLPSVTSPLRAILRWYEVADSGRRHKIFGNILCLAFCICAVRANGEFPAHDTEQAFVSGIEHARPRIPSGRNIADHCGKSPSNVKGKQLRRAAVARQNPIVSRTIGLNSTHTRDASCFQKLQCTRLNRCFRSGPRRVVLTGFSSG